MEESGVSFYFFNFVYPAISNSNSIIHSNVACRVEFLKFDRIHPISVFHNSSSNLSRNW